MEVSDLVRALLAGDLLRARQWVADAQRLQLHWETVERPEGLDARELSVAAGIVEMLATRAGEAPPRWTSEVGASGAELFLDPGLESMPRTLAHARVHSPDGLRKRNLYALPDFLDVR